MITHIEGILKKKTPTDVVIDCGGVGFLIHISLHTYSQLPQENNTCRLFTHLQIKEDAHTLFGFFTEYERAVFRMLLSVSGIGAASARMMLSSMSPEELAGQIAAGNAQIIQTIKGIGAKTAQRIVVELKDKIKKMAVEMTNQVTWDNKSAEEALSALVQLGFSKPVASKSVQAVLKSSDKEMSVEEIVRLSLKML